MKTPAMPQTHGPNRVAMITLLQRNKALPVGLVILLKVLPEWLAEAHLRLHADPALLPLLREQPRDDGAGITRMTVEHLQRRTAFNAIPLAALWIQVPACFLVAWGIFKHTVAPAFPQAVGE